MSTPAPPAAPASPVAGPAAPSPSMTFTYDAVVASIGGLGPESAGGLTLRADGGLGGLSFADDVFPYLMSAFAVVEYCLMVLMVLSNAFILVAYVRGRFISGSSSRSVLRLSSSGRLVLNLAFADMLVGLGLCYFSVFKFWPHLAARLAKYRFACVLRFAICFLTMFGSHCALLVVALDRYTAIVHTLHYKDVITTRMSWLMMLLGWTLPACGAGALFYVNEWRPDVPSCDEHYVVPFFLLTFALPSNVFVLLAISAAHWRVHKEVKAFALRCRDPEFVASARSSMRTQGCRKSAAVLLRVTSTFILCWTPLDVMLVLFIVLGPQPWLLVVFEAAFMLAMTSFLLNPFVYAWKTEAIRRPLVAVLTSLRVLRPRASLPLGDGGAANGRSGPDGGPRPAGVFTVTRDSTLSVRSSSSGSGVTTSTISST